MEMTFPHHALRQDSVTGRSDYKVLLATAFARQANSRTVRVLRRAEHDPAAGCDEVAKRIRYFARHDDQKMAVRGAFSRDVEPEPVCEQAIYQAGLANFKNQELDREATGEQLNHAGHGTLRTI